MSNKDYEQQISQLIKQGGGDEHPGEKVEYSTENDPLFKNISEEKKEKIDYAVEKKIKSLTLDENVDTDINTVPGQNYALISIVAPSSNQKADNICLKIKGVYDKLPDARKQAELLQKMDDTFDIYVVEMYKWLLVPPNPELLEQIHVDNKLNEIIGGHREDQLKSKMYFEERKRELMENIDIENNERKKENEKLLLEEPLIDTEKDKIDTENITNIPKIKIQNIEPEPESEPKAEFTKSIQNDILGHCPNSAPKSNESNKSKPSEILSDIEKNKNEDIPPSKKWADEVP